MYAIQQLRIKGKWHTQRKIKAGPRSSLATISAKCLDTLRRITSAQNVIAKNYRAVIFETKADQVPLTIVQVTKTYRDDQIEVKPEAIQGPDDSKTRRSQYSGGMRMTNAYNLIPGFGTHYKSGRVMHNMKGTSAKPRSSARPKVRPEATEKGTTAKRMLLQGTLNLPHTRCKLGDKPS